MTTTTPTTPTTSSVTSTGSALRLRPRSTAALVGTSSVGLAAFTWPLWIDVSTGTSGIGHSSDAPWLFVILLPLLLVVVATELDEGGMDAKAVALLGVLAGIGCALRVLGMGTPGLEPLFFLLVVAGRVFGPGFGFALGALTLLTSALITAGVGPWLPFQMLAAGWFGLGAGLLPHARGRAEAALLAGYGAIAALLYGLLLDLWFWPFVVGPSADISYVAGDPLLENLGRFLAFHALTAFGFDLPRALTTALLCLFAGPVVLITLRRAARRAAFDVPIAFVGR